MVQRGRQEAHEPQELLVSIDVPSESDAHEVEELSRRLRSELLRLDVESVSPLPGPPAPEGAKAGDAVSWSTLVLTLAASGGVVTTVISALRDWLVRQPAPAAIDVSIGGDSIRLEGSTTNERQQLIEAFLARHDREPR